MGDPTHWIDILSKIIPASLITGIAGYLGRKFQAEGKKKRMREQLYREISNNYQNIVVRVAVVTSVPGIQEGAPFRFCEKLDINFDVWNFYNDEKRREMLFDLNEAGGNQSHLPEVCEHHQRGVFGLCSRARERSGC